MNNTAINFKTIAVDFDGTLCYSEWPNCGQPNHLRLLYRWSDVSSGMYEGLEPMMSAMPFLLICYFPMSRPLRTNSNNLVFPNKRFYHSLDSSFGYTKSVRQFLLSYFWIVLHNFTYLILCIFRFSDIFNAISVIFSDISTVFVANQLSLSSLHKTHSNRLYPTSSKKLFCWTCIYNLFCHVFIHRTEYKTQNSQMNII